MVEQYVCTVCGFNMVEHYPSKCPFCGASQDKFFKLLTLTSRLL